MPTFPATLPLAGAAFVAMLQLTLVGEGWPLRRAAAAAAAGRRRLAVAWASRSSCTSRSSDVRAARVGRDARSGPVAGADFGAALVCIGAWQVLFFVVWRGWPFALIPARALRLACAHAVVLAAGIATFLVVHAPLGVALGAVHGRGRVLRRRGAARRHAVRGPGHRAASSPCSPSSPSPPSSVAGLDAVAAGLPFTRVDADAWVAHASLNAIGFSTILHVAVGRRWPFDDREHRRGALGDNARMRRRDQLEGS